MSVPRTPPHTTLISGSGGASGGGSTPNLNTCGDDMYVNLNTRKRKERSEEEDYRKDNECFRNDIMAFLNDFAKSQNDKLSFIKDELSEIKEEIKTIKSVTENFTQQITQINNDIENIKINNITTEEKINKIEREILEIKKSNTTDNLSEAPSPLYENLILEFKERSEREKNVVIVGVPETNNSNYKSRQSYDMEESIKICKSIIENCPKPTKTMRLGKHISGKNRPLKLIFNDSDTPKLLLRNRVKFPETIKIYSDQTPAQNQYLLSLKKELQNRLDNGETNLTIKYNKGVPQIKQNNINQKN